jgi:hypothetical protein
MTLEEIAAAHDTCPEPSLNTSVSKAGIIQVMMSSQAKNICPNCGYEYESWVEVCPDCDVRIEARMPGPELELGKGELRPDEDPQWTVVTNAPNAMIGNLLKNQLEDAGIPVLMQRSLADFAHSDYVPHDIRVPQNHVESARELIYSIPGYDDGPDFGYEDDEEESDWDRQESDWAYRAPSGSGLPEGFTVLPTEGDVRARQQMRRTHSDTPPGWYWTDETAERDEYTPEEERVVPSARDNYRHTYRERETYDQGWDADDSWSGPSKWIRIIYGILLLVMSLPFILQVLQQMWDIMWGRR